MKEKITESIVKLNDTEIKPHSMCAYFNAFLMKKIIFGYGTIELKDQQYRTLNKTNETMTAKKLRLRNNFPRIAPDSKKNAAGARLINPKIGVAMLVHKLHIEILRKNSNT